ncbi:hypothetical protein SH591_08810 [Sphingomonas sp. LY54]|uniref:hypothetical protein n=1 Tax=Sphingomonas sp. LY54 TaxID=3095343 RepID=UPI002D79F60D|nr:hypothetical protein [Sphingomonas sp. LY54]WRP27224.1 hypothetical protein SH591_08810 [Sphingomonas sp. LY54]
MQRITLTRDEVAHTLAIWLAVAGQKHPHMIRDLWTRKDEYADDAKHRFARRSLADFLAAKLEIAKHEVTREATAYDEAPGD